jgi:hypothetical protein
VIGVQPDRLEQSAQVSARPLDRGDVEQIGAVADSPLQAGRGLGQEQRQVAARGRLLDGAAGCLRAGVGVARALEHEHNLTQGCVAGVAGGDELRHQILEGNPCVRLGAEGPIPHLSQQRTKRQGVSELPTYHQGARRHARRGHWRAQQDVVLAGVPVEQHQEGGPQRCERAGLLRRPDGLQPVVDSARDREALPSADEVLCRGARPVGRELELGRRPRERLFPVRHLVVERQRHGVHSDQPITSFMTSFEPA